MLLNLCIFRKIKMEADIPHLWFQYIGYDNIIEEHNNSLTMLDDFFKTCFISRQVMLFSGMTLVADYKLDDVTCRFYLRSINPDEKYKSIIDKLRKGFNRVNSVLNLDNL
jgi:hypothetical protein